MGSSKWMHREAKRDKKERRRQLVAKRSEEPIALPPPVTIDPPKASPPKKEISAAGWGYDDDEDWEAYAMYAGFYGHGWGANYHNASVANINEIAEAIFGSKYFCVGGPV